MFLSNRKWFVGFIDIFICVQKQFCALFSGAHNAVCAAIEILLLLYSVFAFLLFLPLVSDSFVLSFIYFIYIFFVYFLLKISRFLKKRKKEPLETRKKYETRNFNICSPKKKKEKTHFFSLSLSFVWWSTMTFVAFISQCDERVHISNRRPELLNSPCLKPITVVINQFVDQRVCVCFCCFSSSFQINFYMLVFFYTFLWFISITTCWSVCTDYYMCRRFMWPLYV